MPSATQGILCIYASKLTFEKFCKRATNYRALLWEVFIFEKLCPLSGKCCRRREILQSQLTAQFAIENHCRADFSECLRGAEHFWPAAESHTHTRTHKLESRNSEMSALESFSIGNCWLLRISRNVYHCIRSCGMTQTRVSKFSNVSSIVVFYSTELTFENFLECLSGAEQLWQAAAWRKRAL